LSHRSPRSRAVGGPCLSRTSGFAVGIATWISKGRGSWATSLLEPREVEASVAQPVLVALASCLESLACYSRIVSSMKKRSSPSVLSRLWSRSPATCSRSAPATASAVSTVNDPRNTDSLRNVAWASGSRRSWLQRSEGRRCYSNLGHGGGLAFAAGCDALGLRPHRRSRLDASFSTGMRSLQPSGAPLIAGKRGPRAG
jgi:hypothetical protein